MTDSPNPPEGRPQAQKPGGFSVGWSISIAAHLTIVAALLWWHTAPSVQEAEPSQVLVNLVEAPEPPGPPGDEGGDGSQMAAAPEETIPAPQTVPAAAPDPTPDPVPETVQVVIAPPDTSDLLTDSQLIGVATADDEGAGGTGGGDGAGGGGGGGCNTAQLLQRALRRDPMVSRAVIDAGRAGKAVMLWNGDWVRSGDQSGKGLSGVRQALLWELAFAPEPCRNKQMNGLVLLSLNDGTRFAIGDEQWRWSDLLGVPNAADR